MRSEQEGLGKDWSQVKHFVSQGKTSHLLFLSPEMDSLLESDGFLARCPLVLGKFNGEAVGVLYLKASGNKCELCRRGSPLDSVIDLGWSDYHPIQLSLFSPEDLSCDNLSSMSAD